MCPEAEIEAIVCGVVLKLVLVFDQLVFEFFQRVYSLLLPQEGQEVEWLTEVEGGGHLVCVCVWCVHLIFGLFCSPASLSSDTENIN